MRVGWAKVLRPPHVPANGCPSTSNIAVCPACLARPRSPHESMVLARAIKEHERRNGRREGFADTPADALAYKFYRDVSHSGGAPLRGVLPPSWEGAVPSSRTVLLAWLPITASCGPPLQCTGAPCRRSPSPVRTACFRVPRR